MDMMHIVWMVTMFGCYFINFFFFFYVHRHQETMLVAKKSINLLEIYCLNNENIS